MISTPAIFFKSLPKLDLDINGLPSRAVRGSYAYAHEIHADESGADVTQALDAEGA